MGIPLAPHKSIGPTTCLTFFGVEMDTLAMELRLLQEKLGELKHLIGEWQLRKVCTTD